MGLLPPQKSLPPVWQRAVLAVGCLLATVWVVPRWWCAREADAVFDGPELQQRLARRVARSVVSRRERHFYRSGSSRFDGQSAIAIYQMTLLGLGQLVAAEPGRRAEYLPAMQAAADRLVDPATLGYAAERYGQHGAVHMDAGEGHAYLGYVNLALGMLRLVEPGTRHAALHDRITAAMVERLQRSPHGLIETYPGETWPPDVAAVAGSIGLHATATGADRRAMLDEWAGRFARCAIDRSGYLVQRVQSGGCQPIDAPRGSGTAVASYFIGFAHAELAKRLLEAISRGGTIDLAGFSGVREYAEGHRGGGDVNAGPIVLGASVGGTGFALGAARMHGDRELFRRLYRATHLFGVPIDRGDERSFAVGGLLGDALLLAMLTARRP